MSTHLVPTLAEAVEKYYGASDFLELCDLHDINVEFNDSQIAYLRTARKLITQIEHGNNRKLLQSLIPSLLSRCRNGIATTSWEAKTYHENMESRIAGLFGLIENEALPEQISVDENKPFTAKSAAREFLETAGITQ